MSINTLASLSLLFCFGIAHGMEPEKITPKKWETKDPRQDLLDLEKSLKEIPTTIKKFFGDTETLQETYFILLPMEIRDCIATATMQNPSIQQEIDTINKELTQQTLDIVELRKLIIDRVPPRIIEKRLQGMRSPDTKKTKAFSLMLHDAVRHNIDAIAPFLAHGADINAQDDLFYTPLNLAALLNNSRNTLVKFLLERGASANKKNFFGNTPLHHAAKNNVIDEVRALLKHGAHVHTTNIQGQTPFDLASNNQIKSLLKDAMEKQNAANKASQFQGI